MTPMEAASPQHPTAHFQDPQLLQAPCFVPSNMIQTNHRSAGPTTAGYSRPWRGSVQALCPAWGEVRFNGLMHYGTPKTQKWEVTCKCGAPDMDSYEVCSSRVFLRQLERVVLELGFRRPLIEPQQACGWSKEWGCECPPPLSVNWKRSKTNGTKRACSRVVSTCFNHFQSFFNLKARNSQWSEGLPSGWHLVLEISVTNTIGAGCWRWGRAASGEMFHLCHDPLQRLGSCEPLLSPTTAALVFLKGPTPLAFC